VCCLALSSDGVRLASGSQQAGRDGSSEGVVKIWNLESGDCLTLLHGGTCFICGFIYFCFCTCVCNDDMYELFFVLFLFLFLCLFLLLFFNLCHLTFPHIHF
jgi:WD40 repeat protein